MAKTSSYVPRVNQEDALHLNEDITRLIRDSILENIQSISPGLFAKFQPELALFIQSSIWFCSMKKRSSFFGQQLLMLSYDSEKLNVARLCLHYVLTHLPCYFKTVEEKRIFNRRHWLHNAIALGERIALVVSILNFYRFLKTGRKPSVIDFLLDLDCISSKSSQQRSFGYNYLTRELLWGGFAEILGLVLPIINLRKIRRYINMALIYTGLLKDQRNASVNDSVIQSNLTCRFCNSKSTLPHNITCGHVFCYYCISANILTDSNFTCPICGFHYSPGVYMLRPIK